MLTSNLVIGLGYGDEGKGSWVDHLVRELGVKYIVRFNGGAQALHHVVTPQGQLHPFAQFGSGSFVPEVKTVHSRFMLLEPEALLHEAQVLQKKGICEPLSRLIVSADAPVITPFNRQLNRIQEIARGNARHGSCGFGIGLTQRDVEELGDRALYVRDLRSCRSRDKLIDLLELKLEEARAFETDQTRQLIELMSKTDIDYYVRLFNFYASAVEVVDDKAISELVRKNSTVFEGAQGVLLDQDYGFFPHCTRSNTTFKNALTLLREAEFPGEINKIGLLRGYGTRHGAGPFVTQDDSLEISKCHNQRNNWQGSFRVGWFDAVAARYALEVVGGVDQLAITNLDRLVGMSRVKYANAYSNFDARFFSRDRIHVQDPVLTLLAERTSTIDQIQACYSEVNGWNSDSDANLEAYIEALEAALDCEVSAVSLRPDHHKHYRNRTKVAYSRSAAQKRGLETSVADS